MPAAGATYHGHARHVVIGLWAVVLSLAGVAGTPVPSADPTAAPTLLPTSAPSFPPSAVPTLAPTLAPTVVPTSLPTITPTFVPTSLPSVAPTVAPTALPTATSTLVPSAAPTATPTAAPVAAPTAIPTAEPTAAPTVVPSASPTAPAAATEPPTLTLHPTPGPTPDPTPAPTPMSTIPYVGWGVPAGLGEASVTILLVGVCLLIVCIAGCCWWRRRASSHRVALGDGEHEEITLVPIEEGRGESDDERALDDMMLAEEHGRSYRTAEDARAAYHGEAVRRYEADYRDLE